MTDRPDVVLVTVDSLRADHCSCYGYEKTLTPTLDRMATEGIRFNHAIAPGPDTPASVPPTFTGYYPADTPPGGGVAGVRRRIQRHLARHPTIAERFRERGYRTAAFTPNPWTSRYFGFDRGFDHFEDFLDEDRSSGIWKRMIEGRESGTLNAVRLLTSWLQRENSFKQWWTFCDEAVEWADTADEPYFLWLFLMDAHFPYLPSGRSRTQSRWRTYEASLRLYLEDQETPYSPRVHNQLVTAYDDAIRDVDRCLDRLRTGLDDAVVVVHGDHGEAFGEHGTYGHQRQLYDANVRVPLVASGNRLSADAVADPVSLRSLPELLERIVTGRPAGAIAQDAVFTRTNDGNRSAVRGRGWTYIRDGDGGTLYRLADGETTPVTDTPTVAVGAERWRAKIECERERTRITEATTGLGDDTSL